MRPPGRAAHSTALITGGRHWTFDELDRCVAACAPDADSPRDVVGVLTASMTIDFVAALLARMAVHAPTAVASSSWTADERRQRLAILGRHVELDERGRVSSWCDGPDVPVHPDTQLILFTTGSTGHPKAVQLSAANIQANTDAVIEAVRFGAATSQVLFLPLSYSYGLLGQLLPALEAGMATTLLPRTVDALPALAAGTATGMLSGVPSHFEALLRGVAPGVTCPHVSHVVTAGAYTPPALRHRFREVFPHATLFNNYGQTEASPRILCLPSDDPAYFTAATGYAVPGLRVRVDDETGELLVAGPQVMLGYLGDEAGTRERVRDGWLATGDRATMDERGLVTITGRADELVNIGGERVSAIEVEDRLRLVDGVLDAGVLMVPDDLYGTACVAYVTARPGLDAGTILGAMRARVSRARLPRAVRVVTALPVTPNGKVDKARLRAWHDRDASSDTLPDLRG